MTIIRYDLAEQDILDTGMKLNLREGKWCMMRQGQETIYYDALTKKALIEAYFHNNMEDYTYPLFPSNCWYEIPLPAKCYILGILAGVLFCHLR